MPSYSFKCSYCELRFEKSLKLAENSSSVNCISCGRESSKLPPSNIASKIGENKSIPKDIDLAVGRDAEKKWMRYEDRKREKEKIRKESGTQRLSVDSDGNYSPFSITVDGKKVSGDEGIKYRKEMYSEFNRVKNDPTTEKYEIPKTNINQE